MGWVCVQASQESSLFWECVLVGECALSSLPWLTTI